MSTTKKKKCQKYQISVFEEKKETLLKTNFPNLNRYKLDGDY